MVELVELVALRAAAPFLASVLASALQAYCTPGAVCCSPPGRSTAR